MSRAAEQRSVVKYALLKGRLVPRAEVLGNEGSAAIPPAAEPEPDAAGSTSSDPKDTPVAEQPVQHAQLETGQGDAGAGDAGAAEEKPARQRLSRREGAAQQGSGDAGFEIKD